MSTGNKSKYEGDLSELYRIILQMVREEEDAKEEKESQKELKRKLDDNTDQVLSSDNKKKPMQGFGSRKSLDGSVDSKSSTPSNRSASADDVLFGFMKDYMPKKKTKALGDDEEAIEQKMLNWVQNSGKELGDLTLEGSINNDQDCDILDEFGLGLLINIYCTPGKNFSPDAFKKALTDESMTTLSAHKVYRTLQSWRNMACEVRCEFSTPDAN